MNVEEILKQIIPGKTYPSRVEITEEGHTIKFCLQSYVVGMYCAIYHDKELVLQTGDHNNKGFIAKLKRDINNAIARGAKIEFGSIQPVKTI